MEIRVIIHKVINKLLKKKQINKFNSKNKEVYITFDDGPEPGITDFVLDQLNKYSFNATFFCRGDNASNYPLLLKKIVDDGNIIANHTYSHLHAYCCSAKQYVADVDEADRVLHTNYFRPPYGSITLLTWIVLKKKYKFFYWSLNSGDSDMDRFDYKKSFESLQQTQPGDIVLFHFCKKHEKETRELLPSYLNWLYKNGYTSKAITI